MNYATRKGRSVHDKRCIDQPCERKVICRGRCQYHDGRHRHIRANAHMYSEGHIGLVPVSVKGWGAL